MQTSIDDEAHSAGLGGGFVCNRCYWKRRLWIAAVGIPLGYLMLFVMAFSEPLPLARMVGLAGVFTVVLLALKR